jgi:hypothetical protein
LGKGDLGKEDLGKRRLGEKETWRKGDLGKRRLEERGVGAIENLQDILNIWTFGVFTGND